MNDGAIRKGHIAAARRCQWWEVPTRECHIHNGMWLRATVEEDVHPASMVALGDVARHRGNGMRRIVTQGTETQRTRCVRFGVDMRAWEKRCWWSRYIVAGGMMVGSEGVMEKVQEGVINR